MQVVTPQCCVPFSGNACKLAEGTPHRCELKMTSPRSLSLCLHIECDAGLTTHTLTSIMLSSLKTGRRASEPAGTHQTGRVCAHPEDLLSAVDVWHVHGDGPVKASRPQQGLVENVGSVGASKDNHACSRGGETKRASVFFTCRAAPTSITRCVCSDLSLSVT